jgi:bacterioferritin-associated ferredoxin
MLAIENNLYLHWHSADFPQGSSMYVCVCRGITDRDIQSAIKAGASSIGDIERLLGAGTGCGSCREYTGELLQKSLDYKRMDDLAYAAA